ncbi:MAG: molecular chaperone TorD family protein [Eubacteriales bacterium]
MDKITYLDLEIRKTTLLQAAFENIPTQEFLSNTNFSIFNNLEGVSKINLAVKNFNEETLLNLRVDFTKITCGTNATDPLPYESIYASEKRLFMQDCRNEVLTQYKKMNYHHQNSTESNEPEDNLAIELGFLAHLLTQAKEAFIKNEEAKANGYLKQAASFKKDHITNWVPQYCEEAIKIVESDFCQGLLMVTSYYAKDTIL